MKCANCKSEDIKKVTAIINQNTTTLNLGTSLSGVIGSIGGGGNRVGIGIGKAGTSGDIKSKLVKKIENRIPKKPSLWIVFILGFILFITGGEKLFYNGDGDIEVLLIILVLFFLSLRSYKKSVNGYKTKLEKFNKQWYCFKCDSFLVSK